MTQEKETQLDRLKEILLALRPSGEDGFEGVFADALNRISGVPFRLAKGGAQFGIDGAAAYAEDAVCFECKRYTDEPKASDVIIKIDDLCRRKDEADLLWVLACTAPISTQLADRLREKAAKDGIEVLILDWTGNPPPLAVALAKAGTPIVDKIVDLSAEATRHKLEQTFASIREQDGFSVHVDNILKRLNASEVASIRAAGNNRKWFTERFRDTRQARQDLGQPLAPNADEVLHGRRDDLLSHAVAQLQSDEAIVLLGDDGCGKSWLAAKVMERQETHTLTALFSAEQLPDSVQPDQVAHLLAKQLIRQTDGDPNDDRLLKRWCRRIDAWVERARLIRRTDGDLGATNALMRCRYPIDVQEEWIRPGRFLIVLDGLNQRPKRHWGQIIEVFQKFSEEAGGRLLITCRSHYFRDTVKGRLFEPLKEIIVPEWTVPERDELLQRSGIDAATLNQQTAKSLLNPRLLGIALNVLPPNDEEAWRELTKERLLFEYIRVAERDNAEHETFLDFANRLRCRAREVLERVRSRQRDDLLVFEDQVEAVSEGRFFAPVDGPTNAYELREEGLALALGLALVDRLSFAQRNNRDLAEFITAALDPIASLDDTARVVLAALTAITMKEDWFAHEVRQNIYEALVDRFAFLQNSDAAHYPGFVGLAKKQVRWFLNAAETLTLRNTPCPNSDWIESTLVDLRDDEKSQPLVVSAVTRWLSYYTLVPEHGLFPSRYSSAEEKQEKIKETHSEIETKLRSLSQAEKLILEEMDQTDRDPTSLTKLSIALLAGLALEPFARALVCCSFSAALNSRFYWPHDDFRHLLRLNNRDWASARQALLNECSSLHADDSSSTGKWAAVTILDGTGHEEDAGEAKALAKTLRGPQPWPESWRLVEDYCSVDPCDPASGKPDNVDKTATNYRQMDATQLRRQFGPTFEDIFCEDALPAMARFFPEIAVGKHLQLLKQLPVREGLPLRQIVLDSQGDRPLVDRGCALGIVDILRKPSVLNGIAERDQWIIAQLMLLLAFPLLTGPEHWEAISLIANGEDYLLSLCYTLKPLDEQIFERRLRTAVTQDDSAELSLLLAYARHSEQQLTDKAKQCIASLVPHESERIRTYALGTIQQQRLSDLLPAFVASGRCYTSSESTDSAEPLVGSHALIEAACQGVADPLAVLDSIASASYDAAVQRLGPKVAEEIVRRHLVRDRLDIQNVRVLDGFSLKAFDKLYGAVPKALVDLADLFLGPNSPERLGIHNLLLLTAYAISKDEPGKAKSLFEKAEDSRSLRTSTEGCAKLMLEQRALWRSAAHPLLDEFRFSRLDHSLTDHDLAMEVLAAEQAGRQDILDDYVEAKGGSHAPAIVARGLMVAGFCDDRQEPASILAGHAGRTGFIGMVHSAAEYAFERNRWARHWYQKMADAEDPAQYWLNKCLFAKIVDGRFVLWERRDGDRSSPLFVYHEITERAVKTRCEKWKRKREKKLFGQDAPDPLFVR